MPALRLHNGTVYRWNRACYGIHAGVPHLRIENRVLPSGPTVLDEVANAAFFFGVMANLAEEPKTLQEIGEAMGLSRERIRQIESRAKEKLRRSREAHGLRGYLN